MFYLSCFILRVEKIEHALSIRKKMSIIPSFQESNHVRLLSQKKYVYSDKMQNYKNIYSLFIQMKILRYGRSNV